MMLLVELSTTPTVDLPLNDFKAHLRMGSGFSDSALQDEVLESYLRAAMAAIEARIGKMLMQRRVSWTVTAWSDPASQPLPVSPVTSIISVALAGHSGAEILADAATYKLERDTHRPRLSAVGACLPSISTGGSATITFDAGFGAVWTLVPPDLRQAVFLLAAHYYENRRDTSGAGGLMPFGVMTLLEPHRNIRTLGARS